MSAAAPGFWTHSRPTLALALPIIAGQISQMMMGLVDSAMVGRIGVVPLAAAAFANNLISIPFVFGIGLLACISVRVAQAHGADEPHESGEFFRHALWLTCGCAALIFALVLLLSTQLHHFGQPIEVAQESHSFLLLLGVSLLPALPAMAFKSFCEALDEPWTPTLILLGAVPLNIVFNWIFIYGNLGSPIMGLAGAGLGTLLARTATLLVLAAYVLKAPRFRRSLPRHWLAKLEPQRLFSLLQIGLPAACQVLLEVGAFAVGAIIIGWLGAKSLAAHQIALSMAGTTFMIPLGLSIATSIRVGQVIGATEHRQVRHVGLNSLLLGLSAAVLSALFYALLGQAIAQAFVNDQAVVMLAARLLVVVALLQIVDAIQVVAVGALRGLNDATTPMIVSFIAYWVIGLPGGYLLGFHFKYGAVGIWVGLTIGLACAALMLFTRFWSKSAKIFPSPEA